MWAYGTILWELAAEKLPWSHVQGDWKNIKERVCKRGEGLPMLSPSSVPDEPHGLREVYETIIYHSFSKKPESRPSFLAILNALQTLDVEVLFETGADKKRMSQSHVHEEKHISSAVVNKLGKEGESFFCVFVSLYFMFLSV